MALTHTTPVMEAGTKMEFPDPRDLSVIVDALYRFGAGQDLDDAGLLASAFTEEATLDFVQPAARLGVSLPVFQGRATIVTSIMESVSQLDTTHTVTNPRAEICGNTARLLALVEAQHLPKSDRTRHLLLKNWYDVQLVRAGPWWEIQHCLIRNVWMHGDPDVLFPR